MDQRKQKDLARERFTTTAEVFGSYAVRHRAELAERLARVVKAGSKDRALDLACGPGTLALRFAWHVRWICGLDLTPAMLERARRSAVAERFANLDFAVADAHALHFPDEALEIAVTSFSLHHMSDPARVVGEMSRVVKRGGRVGIVDIRASENPKVAETAHRIERMRDNSHTRSLPRSEFERIFAANGLRILAVEPRQEHRDFDSWMHVAGGSAPERCCKLGAQFSSF